MTEKHRLEQLKNAFLDEITSVPHDLFVPKYGGWVGPQPAAQVHYEVQYEGDAAHVLGRFVAGDQFLFLLKPRLKFRLDEQNKRFYVWASSADQLSTIACGFPPACH